MMEMLVIRHRYHYGSIVLSEHGVLFGQSVIGNNVAVKLKNGEFAYYPYLGAANIVPIGNLKRVKIVNLTGYTFDEDGLRDWNQIASDHYAVGAWLNGGIYVLLKDGHPILFSSN
jgi:hypothetical protein